MESLGDDLEVIEIPDSPGGSKDKGKKKQQTGESDKFTSSSGGGCKTMDDDDDDDNFDLPDVSVIMEKKVELPKPVEKPDLSGKELMDKLKELKAIFNKHYGEISSMPEPSTPVVIEEADDDLDMEDLPDLTGLPPSEKHESISQELVARYAEPSTSRAYFKIFGNSKEKQQSDVGIAKLPHSKKADVTNSVVAVAKNQLGHNNLRSPLRSLPVQLGTFTVPRKPGRRNSKALRRSSFPMGPNVMPVPPIIDVELDNTPINQQINNIIAMESLQGAASPIMNKDFLALNTMVMGKQRGWLPPANHNRARNLHMLVLYLNSLQKFFATTEALYGQVSCNLHSGSAQPPYHGLCVICGWPYQLERAFDDVKVQKKMAKRCTNYKKMMDLLKAPFAVQLVNQEWIYVNSFAKPWWKTFEVKEYWGCGTILY